MSVSTSTKESTLGKATETYWIHGRRFYSYPDLPANLYASLMNSAARFPDKPALIEEESSISYKEFQHRVDRLASSLVKDFGIGKGDVCALLVVNSIDFCVAFYAIVKIGAVSMPLSTKLKSTELLHPLLNSEAKLLFLDEKWLPNVVEILPETQVKSLVFTGEGPDRTEGPRLRRLSAELNAFQEPSLEDGAVLIYTSGTTGKPKGALISHFNILHGIESYRWVLGLTSEDSTIISIPIFHITGLAALLGLFVYLGGSIYLLPFFDAEKTLQFIQKNQITFVHASPTIFILLIGQKGKFPTLPGLRKCACGSANLPIDVLRQLHDWLPAVKMRTVYGLTETSSPASIMPEDPIDLDKLGSSGLPIPGVEFRIVDPETGELLPPGVPGELEVRGSVVIDGYFKADALAKSAFRQGWFSTGDIARLDEQGFVFILDRKKDMINRGGEKVYSIEVENIINNFPDVLECAVIGVPDPVFGEAVKAFIVLRENSTATETDISNFIHDKLAKYKLPSTYELIDAIPKTENGKISKRLLKQRIQSNLS